MRARLFARYGPEEGLEIEFGAEATIGRGEENSVLLSSREVSQRHARVVYDADSAAYWVEDLGSLNGTLVDGEPVSGRQRLRGLHVLSFGAAAELFFVELDTDPGEPGEPEAAAAPRFVLEVGGDAGGSFELREGDNLVGRSSRARIALADRELSRRHATLRVEGGRVWVRDEGSRNHTFVGDERIADEVELEPGSELRFGRLQARLTMTGAAGAEGE